MAFSRALLRYSSEGTTVEIGPLTYINGSLGTAYFAPGTSQAESVMTDTVMNVAERAPQAAWAAAPASIMVYVDFDAGCDKRIKIAADWAAKFNAALIGVAGWLPGREAGGWFAAELERAEDRD